MGTHLVCDRHEAKELSVSDDKHPGLRLALEPREDRLRFFGLKSEYPRKALVANVNELSIQNRASSKSGHRLEIIRLTGVHSALAAMGKDRPREGVLGTELDAERNVEHVFLSVRSEADYISH